MIFPVISLHPRLFQSFSNQTLIASILTPAGPSTGRKEDSTVCSHLGLPGGDFSHSAPWSISSPQLPDYICWGTKWVLQKHREARGDRNLTQGWREALSGEAWATWRTRSGPHDYRPAEPLLGLPGPDTKTSSQLCVTQRQNLVHPATPNK